MMTYVFVDWPNCDSAVEYVAQVSRQERFTVCQGIELWDEEEEEEEVAIRFSLTTCVAMR